MIIITDIRTQRTACTCLDDRNHHAAFLGNTLSVSYIARYTQSCPVFQLHLLESCCRACRASGFRNMCNFVKVPLSLRLRLMYSHYLIMTVMLALSATRQLNLTTCQSFRVLPRDIRILSWYGRLAADNWNLHHRGHDLWRCACPVLHASLAHSGSWTPASALSFWTTAVETRDCALRRSPSQDAKFSWQPLRRRRKPKTQKPIIVSLVFSQPSFFTNGSHFPFKKFSFLSPSTVK